MLQFDNAMAHKIQAGSDAFLMPSRFEPCGLTQMYALKYGTAPVVRATGGLRDTVSEFDPATGAGNGFAFEPYRAEDLVAALARTVAVFKQPPQWRRLMDNCFACDFSWEQAARNYLEWFARLRAARGSRATRARDVTACTPEVRRLCRRRLSRQSRARRMGRGDQREPVE